MGYEVSPNLFASYDTIIAEVISSPRIEVEHGFTISNFDMVTYAFKALDIDFLFSDLAGEVGREADLARAMIQFLRWRVFTVALSNSLDASEFSSDAAAHSSVQYVLAVKALPSGYASACRFTNEWFGFPLIVPASMAC
jgi:hypothetical protein